MKALDPGQPQEDGVSYPEAEAPTKAGSFSFFAVRFFRLIFLLATTDVPFDQLFVL